MSAGRAAAQGRAWVFNLDAEAELLHGFRPQPGRRPQARAEGLRRALALTLPPADRVLELHPDEALVGLEGRAWSPTPSALRRLLASGARSPEAPSLEILRRVNERGFAYALMRLEGAQRIEREAQLEAALRPGRWLLKRGLSFAGRGQRRIDLEGASATGEGALSRLSAPDRAWITASLRSGALYLEPRLELLAEFGLHALLARSGELRVGAPTLQQLDASGQWIAGRRLEPSELRQGERRALFEALERAGEALHAAGYFGPYGIDAFRYRPAQPARGAEALHALSELNARCSMGWPIGMGGWP
ncbi:MAG: hypothetical protein OEY14_12130 [Myxococcales bacterium]|nr:hypothetical protein [Myxococcales bacterium]